MKILLGIVLSATLTADAGAAFGLQDCTIAGNARLAPFLTDAVAAEARCQLADLVNASDVSVQIGRHPTPIGLPLYAYFLDHPEVTSRLMAQSGLATARMTVQDPSHFLVDDGDGAEGLVTVLDRGDLHRLYLIDGQHRSTLFPTVKVKTAVLVQMTPTVSQGHEAVEVSLMAYSRFEKEAWARVLLMMKPLIAWAVKRTLEKQFTMTDRLGTLLAEDPDRLIVQIPTLPLSAAEQGRLVSLIRTAGTPAASTAP